MSNNQEFLVFLNTQDRVEGTDPYDAVFNISSINVSNILNYSLTMKDVEIPNTAYPISAARGNNTIYFQEDNNTGVTYSGTFPEKEYTGSTFAAAIKTIMDAATGNAYVYTVSYDAYTKKLTINNATMDAFRIVDGPLSAHREMGWDVINVTDFKSITAYELAWPIDIVGTNYVDICTNIGVRNVNTTSSQNVLFRVPISGAFGAIIYYSNYDTDSIFMSADSLTGLRFTLRDDRNRLFTIAGNSNVSFTLKLKPTFR